MALRYVGTSPWERTVVDDDGKFLKSVRTLPGTVVDDFVDDEGEQKILSAPRFMRSFVEAGGPEDPYGDSYGGNRYDVTGNATPYPELDMGSTVQPRQSITRTDEENEEGFDLADPNRGPASDNELLLIKEEARQAGVKAEREALENRAAKRDTPTKDGARGSGGGSAGTQQAPHNPPKAEGGEK